MVNIKDFENAMKWGYPAFPFFTSVYFLLAEEPKRKYYSKWNYLAKFENNQLLGYNSRSISTMGDKIIQDLLNKNSEYLDSLKEVSKEIEEATSICLKTRSEGKIKDLEYWWHPGQKAFSNGANLIFGFDNALNEYLEKLKETSPQDYESIKSNIVEKTESFMTTAQKDLLKLAESNPGQMDKVCQEFNESYYWLQNSYLGKFDITEDWCQKTYLENQNKNSEKTAEKTLPLEERYRLLAETATFAITFRDERKKMFLVLIDLMDEWLKIVCRENNWDVNEMKWLTMGELELCLSGDQGLLAKAKQYLKEGKRMGLMNPIGITDIDEKTFGEIEQLNSPEANLKEFRGTIASKGIIRGIVKVVLDVKDDSEKLKVGDILVTSMTRPEFLSLMSRASAFVTDEGGLTCHAGIVAREMNKPCIVGTKNATKILKDGDMVEVDADKGIVRIIK